MGHRTETPGRHPTNGRNRTNDRTKPDWTNGRNRNGPGRANDSPSPPPPPPPSSHLHFLRGHFILEWKRGGWLVNGHYLPSTNLSPPSPLDFSYTPLWSKPHFSTLHQKRWYKNSHQGQGEGWVYVFKKILWKSYDGLFLYYIYIFFSQLFFWGIPWTPWWSNSFVHVVVQDLEDLKWLLAHNLLYSENI